MRFYTKHCDHILRRGLDIIIALLGLMFLSPLLVLLALVVKLHDGGSIFYCASRVGRGGNDFKVFKFRSMRDDVAHIGPDITIQSDARITSVGRFLRRAKLDELPQLVNVLIGDMSLVGPRPEDPRYVALYSEEQRRVLAVRPGITSVASLTYRHEEKLLSGTDWENQYVHEIMPAKLDLDIQYLARRTIITDIGLIIRTGFAILS
ncbi:MAG: sugar transferase [Planctomycetota bacterium]